MKIRALSAISLLVCVAFFCSGCTFFVETSIYQNPAKPTPILDAGHGGDDGGAVSVTGQRESLINLCITQKSEQIFSLFGLETILTRNSETIFYPEDADTVRKRKVYDQHHRLEQINGVSNGFLISIHQNTYPDEAPHGAEILFNSKEQSRILAESLQNELITQLDPQNHRCCVSAPDSIYLMKQVKCPAILVECGFLSNQTENELLQEPDYQLKLATLISGSFMKQFADTE